MRYALISDLHANLQAWNAVHLDIRSNRVDYTICLGDIVGYGPHPAEVLQAVHAEVDALVLGNHDAVICSKLDASLFTPVAQESIGWTRARLGAHAVRFLAGLPLTLVGVNFRCAHGEFAAPAQFNYVLNADEALASWKTVDAQLLFVGHTHDPALFLLGPSGIPRTVTVQDFALEPDKRYFVNVGSVGNPRDGDPRASYCIYDTQLQSVFWRRVPFDLDAYRAALQRAGLDPRTSAFLNRDPRRERPAVRQMLCFSPPRTAEKSARNVVAVQSITALRRRVRAWQVVSATVLVAALLTIGYGLWAARRYRDRGLTLKDPTPAAAVSLPATGVNLLPRPRACVPRGQGCPGWTIVLGNRFKQQVEVILDEQDQPSFALSSATVDDEVSLSAKPLAVVPGMSFYPEALFLKMPGFEGRVAMVVSLTRTNEHGEETTDQFYVKEPNQSRPGGWLRAKQKFDIPSRGTRIQFHIQGKFRGTVKIKELVLTATRAKSAPSPGLRTRQNP